MIKRALKERLKPLLSGEHVVVLYGARRVGKTTLLQELARELKGNIKYLNAEKSSDRNLIDGVSFEQLSAHLDNIDFLFIDEAQTIPDIGATLKLISDELKEVQVIVSGSASLDLANKIGEPLTGRKRTLTLYPISTLEMVKTEAENQDSLESRLLYGAYPQVIGLKNYADKKEELFELVDSYLYKDILELTDIRNSDKIKDLLTLLALQIGAEVSLNELSRNLSIHVVTVQKYLDLLEKCFVIYRLKAFSRNLRKEVAKSSKYYFYDLGVRNAILNNFSPLKLRNDVGGLWENFLISEKIKQNEYSRRFANRYFWRTYDQQEIDYIEEVDGHLHAYEFKYNPKAKVKKPQVFLSEYENSSLNVISPENYISEFLNLIMSPQ